MVCRTCQNPLRVISGGNKIVDNKIVTVHVWGCLNPNCKDKEIEQTRTETPQESFNE